MESALPQKQYSVQKQGSTLPGWSIVHPQGSDCEFLHEYTDSGLCPVLIDDVLEGQDLIQNEKPCSFRIIGKLGWGSYSTVWLGKETHSGEYLALKVLRLQYSKVDNFEMSILRKLEKLETAFFYTHVPTQDQFLCLGLKPLGCTLRERRDFEITAPRDLPSLTILVKTLLMKVLHFHQKQICHGDISPSNVSLGVHSEAFTDEALHKIFEFDQRSNVTLWGVSNSNLSWPSRPTNLPEYIVVRHGTPLKTNEQDMSLVDLIDFGKVSSAKCNIRVLIDYLNEGFETSSKSNVLGTENYSAPELDRNGANIATAKSDLWSLGCVFAYARTSKHLFGQKDDLAQYLAAGHDAQLSFIESKLGSLKREPEYFDLFARLIHSLVRANPEERDPEKTRRIIKQLEAWKPCT